jgi:hypothetical protein
LTVAETLRFHRLRREPGDRPSRRFLLGTASGLHCGDPIAIRLPRIVVYGRVEYSDALGWYFTDDQRQFALREGMSASASGHPRMSPLGPSW